MMMVMMIIIRRWRTYYVPDTVFRALQASQAILTATLGRCCNYPHFIDGHTEAQRSRNILAKATQQYIVELEFTHRLAQSPSSQHSLQEATSPSPPSPTAT